MHRNGLLHFVCITSPSHLKENIGVTGSSNNLFFSYWYLQPYVQQFSCQLISLLISRMTKYFFCLGQMLVPATAEDLKSAGKITVSPNFSSANNGNSVKAVQIKVTTMPPTPAEKVSSHYLFIHYFIYTCIFPEVFCQWQCCVLLYMH